MLIQYRTRYPETSGPKSFLILEFYGFWILLKFELLAKFNFFFVIIQDKIQDLLFFFPQLIDENWDFIPWHFTKFTIIFCNCPPKFSIFFMTEWQNSQLQLIDEIHSRLSRLFFYTCLTKFLIFVVWNNW